MAPYGEFCVSTDPPYRSAFPRTGLSSVDRLCAGPAEGKAPFGGQRGSQSEALPSGVSSGPLSLSPWHPCSDEWGWVGGSGNRPQDQGTQSCPVAAPAASAGGSSVLRGQSQHLCVRRRAPVAARLSQNPQQALAAPASATLPAGHRHPHLSNSNFRTAGSCARDTRMGR